jgi:P27 family predicted phage terminase small subunit
MLVAMGTAKPVDRAVVAVYCYSYGELIEAVRIRAKSAPILKTTDGNWVQNPIVGVIHRAEDMLLKYASELGIGAATRSRINIEKQDAGEDMLERILSGEARKN